MLLDKAHETLLTQPGIRNRLVHVPGARVPPRAATIHRAVGGTLGGQAATMQFLQASAPAFPLPPEEGTQFPPDPLIQGFKDPQDLGPAIVPRPASQHGRQFAQLGREIAAPPSTERLTKFVLAVR